MQGAQEKKITQKKFTHLKSKQPIQLMETFHFGEGKEYRSHFVVAQYPTLFIGSMQRNIFNVISQTDTKSPIQCFTFYKDFLYFGLENGCIMYTSVTALYNQIPFIMIESINGKSILCVVPENTSSFYSIDSSGSLRNFCCSENSFRCKKSIQLGIDVTVVKTSLSASAADKPCLMILVDDSRYPILVSKNDLRNACEEPESVKAWLQVFDCYYLKDERVKSTIICMDFLPDRNLAVVGERHNNINVLKIVETEVNGRLRFVCNKELTWEEKGQILDLSLFSHEDQDYVGFVSDGHISSMLLPIKGYPGKKTKNSTEKKINAIRWNKDKHYIIAGIKDVAPRMYCLEEEI